MLSGSVYLIVFSFSSQYNAAVLHNTSEVVLPQKRVSASLQKEGEWGRAGEVIQFTINE